MSRIDQLFAELRQSGQTAFMPFVTAGDPDLEFTEKLLLELDSAGCHLVELGIPYSDPVADGPIIQASYTRALEQDVRLDEILEMLTRVKSSMRMPIVLMVSYAIIWRFGVESFLEKAIAAGVSGAIVPDLPVEESRDLGDLCRQRDFSLIQFVTPTTPRERATQIASEATGFIYYVSVTGITGERTQLPLELVDNLSWLRSQTDLPICVGFGISRPEHVSALKPVADGVIVGSALVKRIAAIEQGASPVDVVEDVSRFSRSMLSALED